MDGILWTALRLAIAPDCTILNDATRRRVRAGPFSLLAEPYVANSEAELETLLDYLRQSRGFDFAGYKRTSLARRIGKRMQMVGVAAFNEYMDYLEVHPEEFETLFNTILINVTTFFRDPAAWDFITESVIPEILNRQRPHTQIRVWSAGCASGEEPYTLAMLFAEALGPDAFRERVKIYATDLDEEALAAARQAAYNEREVADVPPPLLERYFDRVEDRFCFRKDFRRQVIFGRHDLLQDAPISRVDLLVCRNTLMYFNAEAQARILSRFQFALNEHGVLFLGRAETLLTHVDAFAPLDAKRRISVKLPPPDGVVGDRVMKMALEPVAKDGDQLGDQIRAAALESIPTAQILVDSEGLLAFANASARTTFGISKRDVSRPLQDLRVSYRPVEVRAAIDQAYANLRPTVLQDVEWLENGASRWFEVHVIPLIGAAGAPIGASIAFHEITAAKRLRSELERTHQELETAYEELQSTNEELETTNEELQSTVEELETTNEELQSTNEELETMNEELQSTNEELHSMNDEIQTRGAEVTKTNLLLESVLGSINGAVIVIDRDLAVLLWNDGAQELWGLRDEETRGKNIFSLDIGLPVERLRHPMRGCLSGTQEHVTISVNAINRRGRPVTCMVTVSPLVARNQMILGIILIMHPDPIVVAAGDTSDGEAMISPKSA